MAKRSITRRWIANHLGVVLLILLVVELGFVNAIQTYYYNSARQYLISKVNAVSAVLTHYAEAGTSSFSSALRNMRENFSDKDKMELMAVDSAGKVVLTSSGFSPEAVDAMEDYDMAMETDDGSYGYSVSRMESGEKIMAVTCPLTGVTSQFSAVRVVTSLSQIDASIIAMTVGMTCVCAVILLLIVFSGLFFIGTIVNPIQQISATAGKFAKGDFSVRISSSSEDEIGDLCVAINHMADELSSAEAMKNEFISSVSHELRTPLTAIKGWAETLSADPAQMDETTKRGLRVIVGETERLSHMVEELLDFSRMQSGHFTLQQGQMDILAELGEAILIYLEKAKQEQIAIDYTEPEMLPIVYGDKSRLRQVFINIIDNAVKYSNSGDTVTIRADAVKDRVRIVISDTGCGISKADMPRIKTKFFKANQTRRGSGIGLAIADEIIQLHGGSLELSSEEGKGTSVTITLPVYKPEKKA